MRLFWIVLAMLSVGAGAWVVFGDGTRPAQAENREVNGGAGDGLASPALADAPRASVAAEVAAVTPEPAAPTVAADASPASSPAAMPEVAEIEVARSEAVSEAAEPAAPEVAEPAALPAEAAVAAESEPEAVAAAEPEAQEATSAQSDLAAAAEAARAEEEAADEPAAAPGGVKAEIVRQPDGSMLVDKRFVVKGSGTPQDPYQVTWDLLVSAGEVYQPRQGRTELPERVMMLAGKHVKITGNIAFPLMAQEANELLAMLNQWDGCCIGVPPTPYDAIEVRLREAAQGSERFATFGTVSGRLEVKPHLVGNWLVGLYVMDDATLQPAAYDDSGA